MVNGKVWVDVLTPKQVLLFKPLIDELEPTLNAYLRSIGPVASQESTEIPESSGQ